MSPPNKIMTRDLEGKIIELYTQGGSVLPLELGR